MAIKQEQPSELQPMSPEDFERMDMTIRTEDYNSKPGVEISIADVDEKEISQYYLSAEKQALKRTIWNA